MLVEETDRCAERRHRHGQRCHGHQRGLRRVAAERPRRGGAVTVADRDPPLRRARDGDADLAGPARPARGRRSRAGGLGRGDGHPARGRSGVQHVPRRLRRVPARPGRGRSGTSCPPEVAEVLDIADRAGRATNGAFSAWLPGPDGEPHLDPSGVVKGWAVERAASAPCAPSTRPTSASPPAVMWSAAPSTPSGRGASGSSTPAPRRIVATVPVRDGARWRRPAPLTAALT